MTIDFIYGKNAMRATRQTNSEWGRTRQTEIALGLGASLLISRKPRAARKPRRQISLRLWS